MKNKGWIIFGIFAVAAIIAFAIYKASGTTNTVVTTSGGSETNATNGIGTLVTTWIGGLGSWLESLGGDSGGEE